MLVLVFGWTSVMGAAPIITSFSPASGAIGSSVTITGSGFNTTAAQNIVFFGATKAVVTAASANSLTVTVPLGATYEYLSVTNLAVNLTAYSAKPFIVTLAGSTNFLPKVDFATAADPHCRSLSIGDFDGDGKPDLAVSNANSATVSVFRNTSTSGTVSFAAKVDFATGPGPLSISIGDIDGDGKPDLVAANQFNCDYVSVLRNTSIPGMVSFAAKADFATGAGSSPISVCIGDLDGDGKPDLAVANVWGSTVSVLRNTSITGTVSFATKVDFVTGTDTEPFWISIGDMDGDGKPDLAICNSNRNTNTVSVFRNTSTSGNVSLAAKVDFPTSANPRSISIGDIDGDGKLDLAVAIDLANLVSVFLNTSTPGNISLAAKADFTVGIRPFEVSIGDINGDGKPDLAVSNQNSNTISVLRNTSIPGTASFAAKADFATGTMPVPVSIGDIDGDGGPDLVVTNETSNTLSVIRQCMLPSIGSQSTAAQTQCLNGTFSAISVTANGTGLSYQWFYNTDNNNTTGTSLNSENGAQTNSYTPQAGTVGTLYYYCVVIGTCGTVTSGVSGAFIVNPLPTPSTTPFSSIYESFENWGSVPSGWAT